MPQTNEKLQENYAPRNWKTDKIRHTRTQTRPTKDTKMDKPKRNTPRMDKTRNGSNKMGETQKRNTPRDNPLISNKQAKRQAATMGTKSTTMEYAAGMGELPDIPKNETETPKRIQDLDHHHSKNT